MGSRRNKSAGAIYNTAAETIFLSGAAPAANEERYWQAFASVATPLLLYDRAVFMCDTLCAVPLLLKAVGFEYLLHLLESEQVSFVRTRAAVAAAEDGRLMLICNPRDGTAKCSSTRWYAAAYRAEDSNTAAARAVRWGVPQGSLADSQVERLIDAVAQSTTLLHQNQLIPRLFDDLAADVSQVNAQLIEARCASGDVLVFDGGRLRFPSPSADVQRLRQLILNHLGRKKDLAALETCRSRLRLGRGRVDLALPSIGFSVSSFSQPGIDFSQPGIDSQTLRHLAEFMKATRMPDVGQLFRLGRLKPKDVVDLRESRAGESLRHWYWNNVVGNPDQVEATVTDLIQKRVKGSVGWRVFELLLTAGAGVASAAVSTVAGLDPGTNAIAGGVGSVCSYALCQLLVRGLSERNHPLTVIERLNTALPSAE